MRHGRLNAGDDLSPLYESEATSSPSKTVTIDIPRIVAWWSLVMTVLVVLLSALLIRAEREVNRFAEVVVASNAGWMTCQNSALVRVMELDVERRNSVQRLLTGGVLAYTQDLESEKPQSGENPDD